MRTNFRYCFLSVLLMTSLMAYAERTSISHDFADMVSKSQLTATNSNKTITTADMIYTCVGTNAVFAKDHFYNSKWSIKLLDRNDKVTTTLIDELCEIDIVHCPEDKPCENIKIYVSNDSIEWGDPLSGSQITYDKGSINATVPRDSYYVRILNNSTTDVSLIGIVYYQDHCPGCFLFKP